MKGEKRDRQTAKQSCQPLGKLKIKKREEEKEEKKYIKKIIYIYIYIYLIIKWNKINDRMNEIK